MATDEIDEDLESLLMETQRTIADSLIAETEEEERDILLTGDPIIEQSSDEEVCPECPKNDCSKEPEAEPEAEPEVKGEKVDADLKKSLEEVDPWMAKKLQESADCSS